VEDEDVARHEDDILDAVLHELAESGYEGLKVEAVAERAGVARTTIYRNWPDREALARDALTHAVGARARRPDTGSLRDDLREVALGFSEFTQSTHGMAVMRLFVGERGSPELSKALDDLRDEYNGVAADCIRRAIERGEVSEDVGPARTAELIAAAAFGRSLIMHEPFDAEYAEWLVDALLRTLRWRPLPSGPQPQTTHAEFEPWDGQLAEDELTLIDAYGSYYSDRGNPKSYGRLLGLLVVAGAPVAPESASKALDISRASISTVLSALRDDGLVASMKRADDRVTYLAPSPRLCARMLDARAQEWAELEQLTTPREGHPGLRSPRLASIASVARRARAVLLELKEDLEDDA